HNYDSNETDNYAANAPFPVPGSSGFLMRSLSRVAAPAKTLLPAMREKLGVKLEQATIGGVNVFVLTPQTIAPESWQSCPEQGCALDLLDTPGARVVRVSRRLPHGSTSCDRAFQRSTGVHGLLQFLGPVFVLSRRNPPMVFGIWIAK
ncbi:MAG: hypothetical protein WBZ51_06500, partial [Xanthobacteraceae bacterium]